MGEQTQFPGTAPVSEGVAQILPPGVSAPPGAVEASAPARKGRKTKATASTVKASLVVPEEQVAELQALREEYANDLRQVQDFPLDTQEQADMLTAVCQEAKKRLEGLEERMKRLTDPLNAAMKEARALYAPPIEFLKSIRSAGKMRLEARFAQQRSLQAQALQAVSSGERDAATLAIATGAEHVKPAAGSYEVEDFDFEITDLTQLPGQFWVPNGEMLKAYAREHKTAAVSGGRQVPGVRFYSTRKLTIGGAR